MGKIKTWGVLLFIGINLTRVFGTDSIALGLSITDPVNNASIDATFVDVHGTFSGTNLKQITVGSISAPIEIPASIRGNTFEARNVFLQPGTNTITAIAEDTAGNTSTNTITIMAPTDANTAQTLPVQVQTSIGSGFVPLTVVFNVQTHVPGEIQKVFYDFDGDNTYDQTNSSLQPVSHTYNASGEFFPIVTIQTSVGRFSSLSGMTAMSAGMFGGGGGISLVNVQSPPVLLSTIKIEDPVDIKWTAASNLYVLSGNTAAITEFDSHGNIIRSTKGIGTDPSGLAVDTAGNIYVAVTGKNQVWKLKPVANSFAADSSFGSGGFIGNSDGSAGSNSNQFNAPFDVTLSSDGKNIIVSDSGNGRLQYFSSNGRFTSSSSDEGIRFNSPTGLAPDELGAYLFVIDSGNNQIILMDGSMQIGASGTNGTALGQFHGPVHLSANERALYVADTGNNRVQIFSHVDENEGHSPVPFNPRATLSGELGLNHPKSIAAVHDFLEEKFYIADTGNNRVILVKLPLDNPEGVWKDLISRMKAGDASGALNDFSVASKDEYQQAFSSLSKDDLISTAKDMENIKPSTIQSDQAEYYFESVVDGKIITFPVEFDKEFGRWKVMEY
ncbi:MAG TPA: hypothetical protein VGI03_13005 [Verrucomicrobiae bacterium]|jgi:DNA-binding beta-propeller fold protein YncE